MGRFSGFRALLLCCALLVGSGTTASASEGVMPIDLIVGEYTVTGHDPYADIRYAGVMVLERRGDAMRYEGRFNGEVYEGVALFDPSTGSLALQYTAEEVGRDGVGLFTRDGDGFFGIWSFQNDTEGRLGAEIWVSRPVE